MALKGISHTEHVHLLTRLKSFEIEKAELLVLEMSEQYAEHRKLTEVIACYKSMEVVARRRRWHVDIDKILF